MTWLPRESRPKYGQRRSEYGGRVYDSRLERDYAMILDVHLKERRLAEVKPQHKIFIKVNGHPITTHIVDFLVTLPDGRQKYVEVKGFPTDVWAIKKKLVEATEELPYLVNPTDKQLFA